MKEPTTPTAGTDLPKAGRPDFETVYGEWFHDVCRWARALGAPESDIEDVAQDVFLAVERRLPFFEEGNLPAWLYTITARATRDHRRRAWFRRLVRPREFDVDLDELRRAMSGRGAEPTQPSEIDRMADRRLLERLLEGMSPKKRSVLTLFELEGMSGEEIAALQGVPLDTVWSRLHHARKEMKTNLARLRRQEEL